MATERPQLLEQEYLPVRAKLLEIAASFDRLQRQEEENFVDPRWQQFQSALQILQSSDVNRAEQLQLLFSRNYDEHWRQTWEV